MPECTCGTCVRACSNTPGWFRPGEAEKAARLLGMPMKRFFKKYLGVNWYTLNGRDIFVLAPAITHMSAGREYPGNPKGTCVFLKDNRCSIHAAKPHDCRTFNACEIETNPDVTADWEKDRITTVRAWKKAQPQIKTLLGRRPESVQFSIFDYFFSGIF